MGILNLRKKKTEVEPKTERRNTISCRVEVLDFEKAKKAIAHNMRLVKCKAVVESKSKNAFVIENGRFIKIGNGVNRNPEKRKSEYLKFTEEYEKIENRNRSIIDDPDNFDNKRPDGKNQRWGSLKHKQIMEGIIHVGVDADWGKKELGNAIKQAVKNINKWLVEIGSEEAFNVVFHGDEKGKAHIHFLACASNVETGKSLDIMRNGDALRNLQDRVVESMQQYDFRRGARWDIEGSNRKLHLSILEYQEMQDSLKENLKLKAENEKLKDEQNELKKVENALADITHHDINEMLMNLNEKNKNHPKYEDYKVKLDKAMKRASDATAQMELNERKQTAEEHRLHREGRNRAVREMNKVNKLNKSMDRKPE